MPLELKQYSGAAPDDSRVAQIRRIYEAGFPPIEQMPFEHLVNGVATGREFLLTLEDGDRVLAFATLRLMPSLKALYLEYLAVDPDIRSQGLGGRIVDHAVTLARAREGIEGVILEVMSPDDGVEGEEKALRERRMGFYRRHGAELIEDNRAYRAPDAFGGVLFLRLMWIPVDASAAGYPSRDLRGFMLSFYRQVYGRGEEDALVQAMLNDLPPADRGEDIHGVSGG